MPRDDHEDFFRSMRETLCYQYDVFISYSTEQHAEAKALYEQLVPDLRVFFAPESLRTAEHAPNQFVDVLQVALVQSTQLVVLLSASYLRRSWCLLEMHGYFNLLRRARQRQLWIVPVEPVTGQLIGQLVPFITQLDDVTGEIRSASKCAAIHVGDQFSDHELPKLFVELPLRQFYEPPTRHNRPPWGKDARSPHGVPGAPGYAIYEQLVREYMVQIMRGYAPNQLTVPVLGITEKYSYMSGEARKDAERMINLGASPFQGVGTRSLGDWLREIRQARDQGQDAAEMDRLEGVARAKAGLFDEGIGLIRRGLDTDEPVRDQEYYLTEIARAEYHAKRYENALEVLAGLNKPLSELATLVRAATLARLRRLPSEEIAANRNSSVRLNEIRIDSDIERREDLDHWVEGLELAGFQH